MRRYTLSLVLLFPILLFGQAKKPLGPEALKAEADRARAEADATQEERCTDACLDAARKLVEVSNQNFIDGQVDLAHANMQDAGKYAVKAGKASMESNKRQKQTEIGLRRLTKRIKDIDQTLNFEDRAPVEQIIKSIEDVRSDLLFKMFGSPGKTFGDTEKKKEKK